MLYVIAFLVAEVGPLNHTDLRGDGFDPARLHSPLRRPLPGYAACLARQDEGPPLHDPGAVCGARARAFPGRATFFCAARITSILILAGFLTML